MRAWKFLTPEKSGRFLLGVTLEDETPVDLENVGDGRRKPARWQRITQARLVYDLEAGQGEFVAFSRRALLLLLSRKRGLARNRSVRTYAERQARGPRPDLLIVRPPRRTAKSLPPRAMPSWY